MSTQCSLCRKAVIQVLRVDLNTVFETYVRVLSTTEILPHSEERKRDVMEVNSAPRETLENHQIYTIENPLLMFEGISPTSSVASLRKPRLKIQSSLKGRSPE